MINTNYSGYNLNPGTTKQKYIDKFDKSVKMPFLKVLNDNALKVITEKDEDIKVNTSELVISDNAELSSAVTGATEVANDNDYGTL